MHTLAKLFSELKLVTDNLLSIYTHYSVMHIFIFRQELTVTFSCILSFVKYLK